MAKITRGEWECVCVRAPLSASQHGEAKITADQPKNHRNTAANVRAICASVMKKFPIMVALYS